MSAEDELQEPLIERLSASPEAEGSKRASRKRKRTTAEQDSRKASKKTKKSKAIEEDEIDFELGINNAFSHMDNQLLADYLAQRTRKYQDDLSTIELEDKYIPGSHGLVA
jgi:protein CMS1